jgi:ribonuclease VapC
MTNAGCRDDRGHVALIAIPRDEPEAQECARTIEKSTVRRVSVGNFIEAALLIDASRDSIASRRFDELMQEAQTVIEPVTEAQARVTREAYRDFGKGSGHPARLNFKKPPRSAAEKRRENPS